MLLCVLAALALAPTAMAATGPVCRVTTSGVSTANGSAWAQAMDLQTALVTSACNEVWVAKGVYKPTTTTDRAISFKILPGVAVYGGFAGIPAETQRINRDPVANVTVLSGDVDGNDTTDSNGIDEVAADIQGNNSYHVVFMDGTLGTRVTASTVLDGFTISGGDANGVGVYDGVYAYNGGGLYCFGAATDHECSPTFSNITFSGNNAKYYGGAMYNDGYDAGASSPSLSNVTFSGNSAAYGGGAMYNAGSGGTSSPTLSNVTCSGNSVTSSSGTGGGAMYNNGTSGGTSNPGLSNVTFTANSSSVDGGAMYNTGYAGSSTPTLANVTFNENVASSTGGAIFNYGRANGICSPTLSNVTFSGNSAAYGGGGAMFNIGDTGTSAPLLHNVILWNDMQGNLGSEIHNYGTHATATIDHSVLQGGCVSGDGNICTNVTMADPQLGPLTDNGGATQTMLPGVGSSAIDSGDDVTCMASPVNGLDQRGVARPQGAHCDIGAVEVQADIIFSNGFELP